MQVNYIIVGQGLCGTWLSWWLMKAGQNVLVVDEGKTISSSRIASGVINPVTGRVLAKTWLADALLPFALESYWEIGNYLGIDCISQVDILHAFPTQQMQQAFEKRSQEIPEFLNKPETLPECLAQMNAPFGFGRIHPVLLIDLNLLLNKWKQNLIENNSFLEEKFDLAACSVSDKTIRYKNITAQKIIFCDGVNGMELPFFNRLPFAPNKGEALLLEIEGLPSNHIYKKGISLVPFPHFSQLYDSRYFWAGSTYENRFVNGDPTEAFRLKTEAQLRDWLKLPFKVLDHWASIRPATVERRPFVGFHPVHPQIGILNGMGTKGCSLAPFFGKQLMMQLVQGSPIQPEAAILRFSGILSA